MSRRPDPIARPLAFTALLLATLLLAGLGALAPAPALAAGARPPGTIVRRTATTITYAPPGKAGASEYFETVPTAGGGVRPPVNLASPPAHNLDRLGLGGSTARTLATLGKDGAAAADWARASAPPLLTAPGPAARPTPPDQTGSGPASGTRPGGGDRAGSTGVGLTASAAGGGSAIAGVLALLGGSDNGGIGTALPVALIALLLGALGFALGRRYGSRRA